ncbi:MAG: UvrD-helicase domain-containing protein [Acidiferrobacterales bacterium]
MPQSSISPGTGCEGITPANIVAFTFTEKAAGELKDRLGRIVGHYGLRFLVATMVGPSQAATIRNSVYFAMGRTCRFSRRSSTMP